jgi:hypothetical protein
MGRLVGETAPMTPKTRDERQELAFFESEMLQRFEIELRPYRSNGSL